MQVRELADVQVALRAEVREAGLDFVAAGVALDEGFVVGSG